MAPELNGAMEAGKFLAEQGVIVSAAHTNASFDLHVQLPTEKAPDAIQSIDSQESEAEYFNLQGLRINEPVAEGFYIERRGNKLIKHFVK